MPRKLLIHKLETSSMTKKDTNITKKDTIKKDNKSKNSDYALSSKVDYKANDSIRFDIAEEKVYLFGKAEIKYEDIDLTCRLYRNKF